MTIQETIKAIRQCINCEYADPGGDRTVVKTVDCHNSLSPRFTPERDFCCDQFLLSTTLRADVTP